MSKIYTGLDRAKELGFKNFQEMIFALAKRNNQKWNGQTDNDPSHGLEAHINAGRWAVICECGVGAYAEPNYPFAFCSVCGNAAIDKALRIVIFPENRIEIENTLLEREIDSPFEIGTQTILMPVSKPKHFEMHRAWVPGETVEHLKEEHDRAKAPKEGGADIEVVEDSPLPVLLNNEEGGK